MSEIFSLPAGSILTITARNQPAHIEMGENIEIGALIEAGETATYGPYVLDRTFVMTGDGVGSIEPATLGADDLGFGGGGGDGGEVDLPWANYVDGALALRGASVLVAGGDGSAGDGGEAQLRGGDTPVEEGTGGSAVIKAGDATGAGYGGWVSIIAGNSDSLEGGDVLIQAGSGAVHGNIRLADLPTSDPGVADALWNDGGTLKISAGL